jgi:hypothetical protein
MFTMPYQRICCQCRHRHVQNPMEFTQEANIMPFFLESTAVAFHHDCFTRDRAVVRESTIRKTPEH